MKNSIKTGKHIYEEIKRVHDETKEYMRALEELDGIEGVKNVKKVINDKINDLAIQNKKLMNEEYTNIKHNNDHPFG